MRILSVTQSYAPFYEFGGPPVKVEALANGWRSAGMELTVLTADWGFEARQASSEIAVTTKRSPFGWTRSTKGVESVYLPTWFRYRAATWNPAVNRFCRARLQDFGVAHILACTTCWGRQWHANAAREDSLCGRTDWNVRAHRAKSFLKRLYHDWWGKEMLDGAAAVVATAERKRRNLPPAEFRGCKITLRRNGVMMPRELPSKGVFRMSPEFPQKHG
jgi:hypothetical protein